MLSRATEGEIYLGEFSMAAGLDFEELDISMLSRQHAQKKHLKGEVEAKRRR